MRALKVENVRCFRGPVDIPIRPLTLLVGENSTGKSTLLGSLRAAWELAANPLKTPDFNREPFAWGAWDQIAHYHGGQGKRASSFSLGLVSQVHDKMLRELSVGPAELEVSGQFLEQGSHAVLREWGTRFGEFSVEVKVPSDGRAGTVSFRTSFKMTKVEVPQDFGGIPARALPLLLGGGVLPVKHQFSDKELDVFRTLAGVTSSPGRTVVAEAPIRSKPRRTYDPVRDLPGPEGGHIPMVLADQRWDSAKWSALDASLKEFGDASGLFKRLEVKIKGNKPSDPFQIHVAPGPFSFNLIDVGYGVSQALPLIVDSLVSPKGSVFLFQQPEVHLHPKAQAELGSFIATICKTHRHRFLVETHSDYLIDRIRMDVRENKSIAASDVVLLYFSRQGASVSVHPIYLDETGNLVDAPPGYRSFFLEEERRFLGA